MFGLGATELILILLLVLVLFGAGKLPKVMGDLGKGVSSFRKSMDEKEAAEAAPAKATKNDESKDNA